VKIVNARALSLLFILPLAGCGSNDNPGGTGGTGNGAGATGGTTSGSGGTGTGGTATGGTGTGGTGTGGTGTGGTATGGTATGGTATGGTATGGTGTGGTGTGGTGTGGTATGGTGTGGTATGGTGTGGTATGGTGTGGTGGRMAAGGSAGSGTGGSSAGTGAGGSSGGSSDFQGVLQHHNTNARDGLYIDAAFTADAAKGLAVDTSFDGKFTADKVYSQPLYLAGAGGKPDQVFAFTDGNKVYAFDASTGMQTWTKSFGTPIAQNPCGSFSDNGGMGITGTPVIDPTTRTIYFVSATSEPKHTAHAISADDGTELSGWPIAVTGAAKSGSVTFSSTSQKQRAALALVGGKVFMPFGGHVGDCGDYHGWVVGIDTASKTMSAWATRAVGGAVWGSSGLASDGTSLFFATGNSKSKASDGPNSSSGDGGGAWGDSETVFKFATSLMAPAMSSTTDFFLPMNWVALDDADQDMGGTSPILVDVAGATPSKLVVSLGKDGNAYLLDRGNLGGMDATPIQKLKVSSSQIINAMASYHTATATYVVFKGGGSGCPQGQSGGLTTFKISAASPPVMSMAWCGGTSSTGSPSVTSTDASGANTIVWVVGNDNKLHGLDGDTGKSVYDGSTALGTVQTIQTPIVAKGRIFVASNSQIYALKP
jgi:hypothetical protein